MSLLASIKSSDEYTFTHVANVGILTMSQAETLGFKGEQLHQIGVASLLHDVGKLFIPDEILNKTSALTPEERKVIETHTVKGARYLMGLDGIPKVAVLAALEHHLKFDGERLSFHQGRVEAEYREPDDQRSRCLRRHAEPEVPTRSRSPWKRSSRFSERGRQVLQSPCWWSIF